MAEVVQEKSRGLKFAEQQLLRHGWEHGKGLGRAEDGISEAIKVKVKCGKGGVGHKEGEQFTFHWWDHVFNKASSRLEVESDQNGVQLKKTVEEDKEDGMISNKKPRKAALAKAKLYGCFVKSATLLSGQEQPEPKPSKSDDSSSSEEEEDDQKLDLSSTNKLSDADLMKACGGRTAHKGARHGLTMSAKLARLEQQEAEFMAKYGKKSQPVSPLPVSVTPPALTSKSHDHRPERQEETSDNSQRKKKKSTGGTNGLNGGEVSESPGTGVKPKKKKKKSTKDTEEITDAISTEGGVVCVQNGEVDHSHNTKRKRKKKKNIAEQNEEERAASPAAESPEGAAELHTDKEKKKKKRKRSKSSKNNSELAEEEENNGTDSNQPQPVQDCVTKTKKKKSAVQLEEAEVTEEESTVKQKRKKCKKDKPMNDSSNEEALPPKKKKKSKE